MMQSRSQSSITFRKIDKRCSSIYCAAPCSSFPIISGHPGEHVSSQSYPSMLPKRKTNQGPSSRGRPRRATKDSPVSSDDDEDLLPPDAGPSRPLEKPRKAAALAAARLSVDVDDDDHNDFEEIESDAVSAKTGVGKSRGKAAASVAKPTNLDVFDDTDLVPAKSAKEQRRAPARAAPKRQAVCNYLGNDEG